MWRVVTIVGKSFFIFFVGGGEVYAARGLCRSRFAYAPILNYC